MVPMNDAALSDRHVNKATVREGPAQTHAEALVVVQCAWNGWRSAMVRVADLEDLHWFQPSGAPRPLIHASVCCNKFVAGEIPHECGLTPRPHYLVVCLLKRHTAAGVFDELSRRAHERCKT
jgi:hypothetical protein